MTGKDLTRKSVGAAGELAAPSAPRATSLLSVGSGGLCGLRQLPSLLQRVHSGLCQSRAFHTSLEFGNGRYFHVDLI